MGKHINHKEVLIYHDINNDDKIISFIQTNEKSPTTIENYFTSKILEDNDKDFHDATTSRILDHRITSIDSELLIPPSKRKNERGTPEIQEKKYIEDLTEMSTAYYKNQLEKLNYENTKIKASIAHSKRITDQAKEEMIRVGKKVLPGSSVLGQGIDVVTGEARRPLFRINLNGCITRFLTWNLKKKKQFTTHDPHPIFILKFIKYIYLVN